MSYDDRVCFMVYILFKAIDLLFLFTLPVKQNKIDSVTRFVVVGSFGPFFWAQERTRIYVAYGCYW